MPGNYAMKHRINWNRKSYIARRCGYKRHMCEVCGEWIEVGEIHRLGPRGSCAIHDRCAPPRVVDVDPEATTRGSIPLPEII